MTEAPRHPSSSSLNQARQEAKAKRKGEGTKLFSASVRVCFVSLGIQLPRVRQCLWVEDITALAKNLPHAKHAYSVVSAGSQVMAGPRQVNSQLKCKILKLDKSEDYRENFATRAKSTQAWFSVNDFCWVPLEHRRDLGDWLGAGTMGLPGLLSCPGAMSDVFAFTISFHTLHYLWPAHKGRRRPSGHAGLGEG